MKRVRTMWVVALGVATVGAAATYIECHGCIPRDRINDTCEWTETTRFPLDPGNPEHQAHLVEDAHLAEELGIRYADTEHGRRFGVEHHGGLLENGRVRADCLEKRFRAVETTHDVTPAQVQLARGGRNGTFDFAVALLFVPFYVLGATLASGWLSRRFAADERVAGLIATALVSIAVALAGQQVFRLWAAVWEVIRVGNGHMTSIRAASSSAWVKQYAGVDLLAGVVLFWIVATICGRARGASVRSVGDECSLVTLQVTKNLHKP
jgi:hypothetical protein